MPTNVCIFFPDRRLGGGPYYLMRLACELAKDDNYRVFYIDYPDGFARTTPEAQSTDKITFIDWTEANISYTFEEECILLMPIYRLDILPFVNPNSKVIFFNWHTCCIPELKRNLRFIDRHLRHFLSVVATNYGQIFCDGSHYAYCNEYSGVKFPPQFVPLMSSLKEIHAKKEIINRDEINIALLGRLVIDKVFAVNNVIDKACRYKTDKKIILHIIGDGLCKEQVKTDTPKNVEVRFCGVIQDDELCEYLRDNCDVMFAMGTSVLDAAAMKLPAYMIPTMLESFSCDKFVYLPNAKDYIVGYIPSQVDLLDMKFESFEEIIDNLYQEGEKEKLGEECYGCISQNFTPQAATKLLKEAFATTTLRYLDVYTLKRIQDLTYTSCNINAFNKLSNRFSTSLKNKIRYAIWQHYKKYTNNIEKFRKKHPIKYKIWAKLDKKLKQKGLI